MSCRSRGGGSRPCISPTRRSRWRCSRVRRSSAPATPWTPRRPRCPDMPELPEGLVYRAEFVSADEERELVRALEALEYRAVEMRGRTARRTVRHFGLDYDYETGALVPA